ncbi:uncharacterized protein HD556DRAFT_1354209 [Suillus plorans]|uniref:Uncharacterized protein n=1 Tax=Suillus plorans TaxID=116603 RepID=A0A9P7DM43_9AGAM|nr:uncharacterized protein HD556DRAFT_1354209 [Suillus plorans]KAG1798248.1 hypothetical protein HD556DRAFT_1354209 [Suillus plorans]
MYSVLLFPISPLYGVLGLLFSFDLPCTLDRSAIRLLSAVSAQYFPVMSVYPTSSNYDGLFSRGSYRLSWSGSLAFHAISLVGDIGGS